ncbi:sugar-binding transcriptional regulator [Bifidobacterium tibiigranuli]|jgi:DNA-binding transcriptional regulator LsrR (DeoR family)|uniref:sugar-binding transcriptional regulator n=1 Tax=Bifidobacterium tibiigranuli TaxID=2172043 RepID=UPI0026EB29EA|nr:sugar-binding domain-containing protein [Bifidobacterium tibiigranuli]MCI1649241.1 helix-turn-helix domain-containing protein [Bifidobacterium tibiigranuli]MCI2185810.1 helix-turn-helix domain-containing protein [Bifidobacterium tibiigranuli]MCI2203121.1 helix-turn-helix domain-containing protein [Bifidobacterium tibiigranuli]
MFIDESLVTAGSREHIGLVLKVARAYYQDDKTQTQIAKEIGYSHSTISRLLKESRDLGIVHITIGHPLEHLRSLEDALCAKFHLVHARVAQMPHDDSPELMVPRCAAALFTEICAPNSLITVSNGYAVAATVREVPVCDWPKSNVAQMIGCLSPANPMIDSPAVCHMLAQRLGGTFTALPVPMVLSSSHIANAMRKEPQIATALALGGGADTAIVGVGAATGQRLGHIFDDYMDARTLREIQHTGVVGHICGHLIDADGNHIHTELCDRTISIDFERLKRIPMVIGIAWGARKLKAIHACLVGRLINVLVTDRATAEALLEV